MKNILTMIFIVFLMTIITCVGNFDSSIINKGKGNFTYQDDTLNAGRPITVYSYLPSRYCPNSPVLFVIHGNGRNAESYRNTWVDIAEKHNALLLVPHFPRDKYPEDAHYNLGNMFEMDSLENLLSPKQEIEWAFSLIDPIFDYVLEKMQNTSKGYLIYGHSAGSQFLHRLLLFKPNAKILKAVCANAGWYTMPDFKQLYPYGLKGTQYDSVGLSIVFEKNVTILLGDKDTDPNHKSLRRTPRAMRQGKHRFARGQKFYELCKRMADSTNVKFTWDLQIAPGVSHSNKKMAPSAEKILFD